MLRNKNAEISFVPVPLPQLQQRIKITEGTIFVIFNATAIACESIPGHNETILSVLTDSKGKYREFFEL